MSETIESTALATIETTNFALVFVPGGVEAVVAGIEREAREQAKGLDATTPKGRAAIRSLAYKVARSKTTIDAAGKDLNEDANKKINAVNEDRRKARARLDALKAEIEAPADEAEAFQARRIEAHEAAIREIEILTMNADELPSERIAELIDTATTLHADRQWEEFHSKAERTRSQRVELLRTYYQTAKTREDEAEAERIRLAEEAERQREAEMLAQIAREERIAAEAAAEATRLANERAAKVLRDEQEATAERERKAAAELERVEAERLAGVERERIATEKAEANRIAGHRTALDAITEHPDWGKTESSGEIARRGRYLLTIDRDWQEFADEAKALIEAEVVRCRAALEVTQARETEALESERIERQRLEQEAADRATETERKRVAAETERQRVEGEKRAANVAHRAKINRTALAGILAVLSTHWVDDDINPEIMARHVVTALAKGEVDFVKVQY